MKAKWMIRTLLLLGMVCLLTGCWNRRELNEMAIVMAMAVDKGSNTNEYQVSFQIVNPSNVATGTTGGGGPGGATPVTIYTGTGNTLFEAIRKTSEKVPRQLFFAHTQMLIIGETFAKEGIRELFDFFERSHEARLTTLVLVARGNRAETIIRTLTPLEKIPANGISGKVKNTSNLWSKNIKVEIDDVIKALGSESEPVITGVSIIGNPEKGYDKTNLEQTELPAEVDIKGMALFKDGKLKRWLDGRKARGTVWIQNKMKSTVVELDCKDKKDSLGVEVTRSLTDVNADVKAEKPVIQIHIKEEGTVSEVKCPIDLSNTEQITKLEEEWGTETKKEVMEAVKAAQSEKTDIFGFGETVNRADPKTWEKIKKDWSEKFSEMKVDVKVDAFIRRSGMRLKPYMPEHE